MTSPLRVPTGEPAKAGGTAGSPGFQLRFTDRGRPSRRRSQIASNGHISHQWRTRSTAPIPSFWSRRAGALSRSASSTSATSLRCLPSFRAGLRGPEEAFDLAAEMFAAALAPAPRFEPGPEPPQAWLFAIARHKLYEALRSGRIQDEARRSARHAADPARRRRDRDPRGGRERSGDPRARGVGARPARGDRGPPPRGARLRRVAAELQCSESVVRKRVSRGLTALRVQLRQERPHA